MENKAEEYIIEEALVGLQGGLCYRNCVILSEKCHNYRRDIYLSKGTNGSRVEYNARCIKDLSRLFSSPNSIVEIKVQGKDEKAKEIVKSLCDFLKGEE